MIESGGAKIEIKGIVQGVGFRPFVYNLARKLELTGWVRNTSAGVDIQLDGRPETISAFIESLSKDAPPLARIDIMQIERCSPQGFLTFEINHSQPISGAFLPISPDSSICPDCLRELFDPSDRRYLYPFINCTNCGPRFTIIQDIPYDRPNTTMSGFSMCSQCSAEYQDPLDRRFHAQPVACHDCGPQVWLEFKSERNGSHQQMDKERSLAALVETQKLLWDGEIVAVKGLGGFHLACDAFNSATVAELRRRKLRVDKPFAVMMPDIETVEKHCLLSAEERALLESRHRPVVILKRRQSTAISEMVAPRQSTVGVMLPYTPLHYLLFANLPVQEQPDPVQVLVMTSGNLSEEPIATGNEEAHQRLESLADAFLMHNRPIHTRCDDSVMRIYHPEPTSAQSDGRQPAPASTYPLRRSRGYAPDAIQMPWEMPELLATGAELKNTFCLTKQNYGFISHHVGDLENYETLCAFESGVEYYQRLFRIQPQLIAYDLHPNYLSTRYAEQRAEREGLPSYAVQHHHAHIAACMAEHRLPADSQVIGVAFDGTGYGTDDCIWGGEFLVCSYDSFTRPYHLRYTPLPGGEKAIREPWRMALSWLDSAGISWDSQLQPVRHIIDSRPASDQRLEVLTRQLQSGINAPRTSSIGRLFDAVASLAGLRQVVSYEAQAAIEMEALVDDSETGGYSFSIDDSRNPTHNGGYTAGIIDPGPVFSMILEDLGQGVSMPVIFARFHNGLAQVIRKTCRILRERTGIAGVVLSGGVWQNMKLLGKVHKLLQEDGLNVLIHRQVPANDGGISLGQAVVAAAQINSKEK